MVRMAILSGMRRCDGNSLLRWYADSNTAEQRSRIRRVEAVQFPTRHAILGTSMHKAHPAGTLEWAV